jgi:hypothetical protein
MVTLYMWFRPVQSGSIHLLRGDAYYEWKAWVEVLPALGT